MPPRSYEDQIDSPIKPVKLDRVFAELEPSKKRVTFSDVVSVAPNFPSNPAYDDQLISSNVPTSHSSDNKADNLQPTEHQADASCVITGTAKLAELSEPSKKHDTLNKVVSAAPNFPSNPANDDQLVSVNVLTSHDSDNKAGNLQSAEDQANSPYITPGPEFHHETQTVWRKTLPEPEYNAKLWQLRYYDLVLQQIDKLEQSFFSHNKQAKIEVLKTLVEELLKKDNLYAVKCPNDTFKIIENWQNALSEEQKTILYSHRGFSWNSRVFLTESEKLLVKIKNTAIDNIYPDRHIRDEHKHQTKTIARGFHKEYQAAPSASYFSCLMSWLPSCSWFSASKAVYQPVNRASLQV